MTIYVDTNQAEQAAQILVSIIEASVDQSGQPAMKDGIPPGRIVLNEHVSREIWDWYKQLQKSE